MLIHLPKLFAMLAASFFIVLPQQVNAETEDWWGMGEDNIRRTYGNRMNFGSPSGGDSVMLRLTTHHRLEVPSGIYGGELQERRNSTLANQKKRLIG
ncbi:MAG: hypothetical protein IK066_08405 [Kiritimatiellae bacterium]|nr:hypothetical protein [Kiritimatiellia bacterium]